MAGLRVVTIGVVITGRPTATVAGAQVVVGARTGLAATKLPAGAYEVWTTGVVTNGAVATGAKTGGEYTTYPWALA